VTTTPPKRFYTSARPVEIPGGWSVALDGRVVKTPARGELIVPTAALAEAMAAEWDAQGDTLDIARMHLTRLANVAIDRTPQTRAGLAAEVARYCETDLTCHLEARQGELRTRQEAAWRPVRDWAGRALGVVLVPMEGVMAGVQPRASLEAAERHAAGLGDFRLTGLAFACGLFGSAVLGLAVEQGELDALEAFALSILDAAYQAEIWGQDEEAGAMEAERRLEAAAVGAWFETLGAAG